MYTYIYIYIYSILPDFGAVGTKKTPKGIVMMEEDK